MSSYEQFCNRVQTFRKKLLNCISRRIPKGLRRRLDPEDVVSEITFKCPRNVEELLQLPAKRFFAWLRRVATRRLTSQCRRHLDTQSRSGYREIHDSHSGSTEHVAEYAARSVESGVQYAIRQDNAAHLSHAMAACRNLTATF